MLELMKTNFTPLKAEFMLEDMTGLETMSECSFSFPHTVYHNTVESHTFVQVQMNIKLY